VLAVVALLTTIGGACSGSSEPLAEKTSDRRETTESTTDPSGSSAAPLDWGPCHNERASMVGLECASLEVPVSQDAPTPTTRIELARKATNGSERIGSLIMNPGGPGGSGIEFLADAVSLIPESLASRFDLVSFDPRGVGESSPVHCLTDAQKDDSLEGDISPDAPAEFTRAEKEQSTFRNGCEQENPDLIEHMSTADVTADLDHIRAALGDEKLTFLGYSYGTKIGAAYATLHPDRVRALVLDGAVSPSATVQEESTTQVQGFEHTLDRFVTTCNADARCELAPDAASAIQTTAASLDADPVIIDDPEGDRILTSDLFLYAIATGLYATDTWAAMSSAIADVRGDGAKTLMSLVDRQIGRQPDGTYDNSTDAQTMVNCSDTLERPTFPDGWASASQVAAASPTFGPLLAPSAISCVDWPKPANPLPEISAPDAPPILVVGTLGDPATPYSWAQEMTAALGPKTSLLTYEGDGHTAFLRGGKCIEDSVVSYLVDLKAPKADTSCPAQSDDSGFGGIRDVLITQLVDSGVPRRLASCLVDGMIREVGEDELNRMVLDNDASEFTKLAARLTLECASKSGD